jgi:hypothetical protein
MNRPQAVTALLDAEGIPHRGVAEAGPERDVAAVRAEPSLAPRIAALGDRIRALGYRYVSLELEPDGPDA